MGQRNRPLLGTGGRYVITVLIGTTLSMLIAYAAVRALTRGTTVAAPPAQAEARQAHELRIAANELARLTNEILAAMPPAGAALPPSVKQWLEGQCQEDLEAVRQELLTPPLSQAPPARHLAAACARLASLALHPEDLALRKLARAEVAGALTSLDDLIRMRGLSRHVAVPATPLHAE